MFANVSPPYWQISHLQKQLETLLREKAGEGDCWSLRGRRSSLPPPDATSTRSDATTQTSPGLDRRRIRRDSSAQTEDLLREPEDRGREAEERRLRYR